MSKVLIIYITVKTSKSIITYRYTKNNECTHYKYKCNNIIFNHIIHYLLFILGKKQFCPVKKSTIRFHIKKRITPFNPYAKKIPNKLPSIICGILCIFDVYRVVIMIIANTVNINVVVFEYSSVFL